MWMTVAQPSHESDPTDGSTPRGARGELIDFDPSAAKPRSPARLAVGQGVGIE
jgi:hypothetical protein